MSRQPVGLHGATHDPSGSDPIPSMGTGTIEEITSDDGSVVITNPTGPITNLSASGFGPSADNGYVAIADKQTSGTNGGGFTSGAWQTRTVNYEISDASALCVLASNRITLNPGTYRVFVSAPAYRVDANQIRLYNITEAATLLTGTVEYTPSAVDGSTSRSIIVGEITLLGSRLLEIQHKCTTTKATNGFGVAGSFGDEYYTVATFWATNITYANSQTFTSSGTFTVPTGVTSVDVTAWGPGGNGGAGIGVGGGAGGGGGAYSRRFTIPVTPGGAYSVTVGAGGSGTNSSFTGDGGVACIAVKGNVGGNGGGGAGGAGGAAGSCTGDIKTSGGTGGTSALAGGGGGGGSGGALGNGGNGGNATPGAGGTPGTAGSPDGAAGGYGGNSPGHSQNGSAPGGAGGGDTNGGGGGGVGAAGQIIIGWNTP